MRTLVQAARIMTMDPRTPRARFMAISDGLVEEVGSAPPPAGGYDVRLDFPDALITPGLIDVHNHLTLTGLQMLSSADLSAEDVDSVGAVLRKLKEFSKSDRRWILGHGLNEVILRERRVPDRRELDQVSADRPIFITHVTQHFGVCNSKALELGGIGEGTPDPFGGRIGRDDRGMLNGALYEAPATDFVRRRIPAFTEDEYREAMELVSRACLSEGITSVKDTGGTGSDVDEGRRVRAINGLYRGRRDLVRLGVCLPVLSADDAGGKMRAAEGVVENDFVRFVGFKMFMDGSGIARTGWLEDEWHVRVDEVDRGNFGIPLWKMTDFRRAMRSLSARGMVCVHTVGDMASRAVLEEVARMRPRHPDRRFSLIHAYIPTPEQIRLIRKHDVMVETQTAFIYFAGAQILAGLGRERIERMMPVKSYLKEGITVGNSSDSPVTPLSPVYGIYSAMRRRTRRETGVDRVIAAGQRLRFGEAVALYTAQAARCMGRADIGTLARGRRADFVVWDRRIMKGDLRTMRGSVIATFLDGREVYRARRPRRSRRG